MGFAVEYFLPHLPATISQLVHLIGEAESFESKRKIDNALNIVIEQTGQQVGALRNDRPSFLYWIRSKISPFVPIIVAPLPQLCTFSQLIWGQLVQRLLMYASRGNCWWRLALQEFFTCDRHEVDWSNQGPVNEPRVCYRTSHQSKSSAGRMLISFLFFFHILHLPW